MENRLDPVCGMELSPENAPERSAYEGHAYLFCSAECRNRFDQNPAEFADRTGVKSAGPEAA
ncbi:MAG TPA: YHS domain-containing protein [Pyrinomonadaceae bacterium]|nr:YHS domain-containing protein [Pyrinomonadaceae bacterium]